MLAVQKFCSNKGVISESEVYFEAKDWSIYKNGIEVLKRCRNGCVAPDGDYVDE